MKTLLHHPLLAIFDISPGELIPIVLPVAGIILTGVIVVCSMYFQNRRREMWHLTARLALEKGQPLPVLPDDEPRESSRSWDNPMNDLRSGLVCLGVGVGLYLFLGNFINPGLGYVGAIPGFVGVALLVTGLVRMFAPKREASSDSDRRL